MKVDKLTRFTGRASFYAKHRPTYPDTVIAVLKKRAGWHAEATVADLGAGTGLSSELFLRHGNTVRGVEPNADMRAESMPLQSRFPQFQMLEGLAEQTGLQDASFDFVVAATAFHWFDAERCRAEFRRILKPEGRVVLLWNLHQSPQTPLLKAFEQLSTRYADDGRHRWGRERHNIMSSADRLFIEPRNYVKRYLENNQRLDYEGFEGRFLSSSYVALPGDRRFGSARAEPSHQRSLDRMIAELRDLFDRHAVDGSVEMKYQTAVYHGRLPDLTSTGATPSHRDASSGTA